jgi:hypothetical protein
MKLDETLEMACPRPVARKIPVGAAKPISAFGLHRIGTS